ncbi:hypothetical protein BGI40_10140 [Snodgrassella communis]|uniref:Lipoprotein n=3 Tax=Snodgrassella communis TaxID=2946699 RepID=A0A836MSS2_9NEIS|nr:hypothetical protein [Snodgrassella communis]KDN15452.1 hypothetical protein SALWKB29_0556 [Snodgrassella communis]PIT30375.1 hypothetical protein BGI38_00960 [Snodgrassella communis]PIT30578.1 hypothetical protein BGI39_00170 [Snodgrassella communis]PIT31288.1 hypothetical protein BGI40_10140 [Snodgrassella communis]
MKSIFKPCFKLICLSCLLLLAGCDDGKQAGEKATQQPAPVVPHQDRFGRYDSIGNLGGKPVSIPGGVVFTWVRYIGDPGDFDSSKQAQKYQRPPITYQLPIDSFGFQYRLTDGAVMSYREQTEEDYLRDNRTLIPQGKPFPWGHIIVYNIVDPHQPLNFNKALADELQATKKVWHFDYFEQPQKVYGLTYFKANNGIDPSTNQPWQDNIAGPDILMSKNAQGEIKTYIRCDFIGEVQQCNHRFYLDNLPILISITYNRQYLKLWQQTEKNIAGILDSWVVTDKGALIKKQAGKV